MAKPTTGEVKVVKKRLLSSVSRRKANATKTPVKEARKKTSKVSKKKTEAKSISVRSYTDDVRKIAIIENIAKRRVPTPAELIPHEPRIRVSDRMRLSLASLSSVRIDHASLVSNIARYAGTAFVVIGAFLTLNSMSSSFMILTTPSLLTAQTTTSTCNGTDCTIAQTQTNLNTKPSADIRVESSGSALSGTVPVNVTVPYATRIDLIARNKDTNATLPVSSMIKVSDLAWRGYWQTPLLDDGTYLLKAVIVNPYGSYTVESGTDYKVVNHPIDTTIESSTGSNTTPSTTTDQLKSGATTSPQETATTSTNIITTSPTTTTSILASSTLPSVRIELGSEEPLSGLVSVKTLVSGASNIRMNIRPTNTGTSNFLGYAILSTAGEWKYVWDTSKLADGKYDLRAQAIFPNGTSNTRTLEGLTIRNESSTTIASSSVLSTTEVPSLEPVIKLTVSQSSPLHDTTDLYVNASGLSFVELYIVGENSLTPRYLGLAEKQSDTGWRYRFNTTLTPNGKYAIYAHARHAYGDSNSDRINVSIENKLAVSPTAEQTSYIESLKNTGTEVESLTETQVPDPSQTKEIISPSPYDSLIEELDEDVQDETRISLDQFRTSLDAIMNAYGKAIREGDTEKARTLQNELELLRKDAIAELPFGPEKEQVVTRISELLGSIIKELRERIERNEALIKERVGDAATKDSDLDGISDYDEVNLYHTDMLVADTDQDGFNDGIEVLNGYDPLSSKPEANVLYESPREQGVVREDLLSIDHVTSVDPVSVGENPQAHIGGKALPNSFVTLYIFSTPIVITVKADRDGNWSYIFDKELENGAHEIYAGITDNSGQIVAKSNPLSFVKTAEAYTSQTAAINSPLTVETDEPSLISLRALLIIGSLAVVSLGLVLILLGLHVRPRRPTEELALQ